MTDFTVNRDFFRSFFGWLAPFDIFENPAPKDNEIGSDATESQKRPADETNLNIDDGNTPQFIYPLTFSAGAKFNAGSRDQEGSYSAQETARPATSPIEFDSAQFKPILQQTASFSRESLRSD